MYETIPDQDRQTGSPPAPSKAMLKKDVLDTKDKAFSRRKRPVVQRYFFCSANLPPTKSVAESSGPVRSNWALAVGTAAKLNAQKSRELPTPLSFRSSTKSLNPPTTRQSPASRCCRGHCSEAPPARPYRGPSHIIWLGVQSRRMRHLHTLRIFHRYEAITRIGQAIQPHYMKED